ncbi:MAG: hypothetical protein ACTSXP_14420 [Promethearchaeota archaeon]
MEFGDFLKKKQVKIYCRRRAGRSLNDHAKMGTKRANNHSTGTRYMDQ